MGPAKAEGGVMQRTVLISGLLLTALAAAGCGKTSTDNVAAAKVREAAATLSSVEKTTEQNVYEAVGTVRPVVDSTIQSKTTAHVTAVHVREGEPVSRGQLLIELDDREAKARLQQAQSALEEARAARHELESAVQAAAHAKAAAEANNELAQATYDRYKRLTDQGALSRQSFDEANARRRSSTSNAGQAASMLSSAQARQGEADARIRQSEAALADAFASASFTRLTAPFDGIVTSKTVDVGDLAAPGSPLLRIENNRLYRLEAQVEESALHDIRQGDPVGVALNAAGLDDLKGTVSELVPTADPSSRTFVVKVDLPGNDSIRSGMFGRVRFPRGQQEILTVPSTSLIQRGQLTSVYAVESDNIAHLRLVTTGKRYGERTEVLSGLEEGERVVDKPGPEITDGVRIR
jgi:multidrug efflux pump subunit AcrA (membrane-fusion protein)